jgi:tetratricopeptide (TPR) repeat protein
MMQRFLLLLVIISFSCNNADKGNQKLEAIIDNEELQIMYDSDQSDRSSGDIDWSIVSVNDSLRKSRVFELLDSNLVRTALDYSNAAMIYQHGGDTIASEMAVKMMTKAIELDTSISKWLLAAAIDRDLMRRDEPQIYGTQYRRMYGEPWTLYKIDTTVISADQRKEYGVRSLDEQQERVKMMNKKKLSEMFESGSGIEDIVIYSKTQDLKNSEYDLSQSGINRFGYQLMGEGNNNDALKIFKLNTELYPNGANTYDSYGECLLKLGKKEQGIKAYKKSLELNPKNTNAKQVLNEINNE